MTRMWTLACAISLAALAPLAARPAYAQAVGQAPAADGATVGVPPISDADRRAAFPDVDGHAIHDARLHSYVLLDQLEWLSASRGGGFSWDGTAWVGGDVNRLWFRTEGEGTRGRLDAGQAHVLLGRAIARWWDVVAGIRQDVRPGGAQTWAAVGLQGLAPQRFEVQATAYIGAAARTQMRLEAEYQVLLTNRLILQPLAELEIYGKADPAHAVGAGLSSLDTGVRVRYEIKRKLAPYVGLTWNRSFFGTARIAAGDRSSLRLAVGLRTWF